MKQDDLLTNLESELEKIKTDFKSSVIEKDGECVIIFRNLCPPAMGIFIAGAVASFHYSDGSNSANVTKQMNVGSNEADQILSPEKNKCVQNVVGAMAIMRKGVLVPGGLAFGANVPADRCLRTFTTGVEPGKSNSETEDGIDVVIYK